MKGSFVIKSFHNGINLLLNPEVSFEQILADVADKFATSRSFFGSSSVALSIEGRTLSQEEEVAIIDVIRENSDLNVICIVGKDDALNNNFVKALQTMQTKLPSGEYMQIFSGSVTEEAVIEMDNSIFILGDVEAGSCVSSGKNIVVLGALRGEAYAGREIGENAYVIALEMEPESLTIGNFKYRPMKKSIWKKQAKSQAKVAIVRENNVELVPLTKEILEKL